MIDKPEIMRLVERALNISVPPWMRVSVWCPSDCETPYHRFLYLLATHFAPAEIVELGTREGIGAMSMAEGNPAGNIYTFDIQDQRHTDCKRPNIFFYNQDSLQIPGAMPDKIDVLFIDTIHDGDRPFREFEAWKNYIPVGGVVIFDDVTLNDSMKAFWNSFNPMGYEKIDLPMLHSSGFGLLIKQSE